MSARPSVLCLSHLRWNDTEVRPRQLLSACARVRPAVFFEQPHFDASEPFLDITHTPERVVLAVPHLPPRMTALEAEQAQRDMLDDLLRELDEDMPVLWYYSPLALGFSDHLRASAIVYDCLEQLESRDDATSELHERERTLLERADVVFTCSYGLFQRMRRTTQHPNIHPFVSSIDLEFFQRAREAPLEPPSQQQVDEPRIGFYGSIDQSVDLQLLTELACARPDLQLVLLGPLVGLDPDDLPCVPNLHWLGVPTPEQIPAYLAGWDVVMLPLAHTDTVNSSAATRAAECLAAGKPVVSTSVADIVEPWGRAGLVWLGDDAGEFADAIDDALASDRSARLEHGDDYLADHTWLATWCAMWMHIERAMETRTSEHAWRPSSQLGFDDGLVSARGTA